MLEFINLSSLLIFIPTFIFVSITPGMCMMLSLSMGINLGVKKTMFMMYGELLGVAIVAVSSMIGVATIMLKYPYIFIILKYGGGGYLIYIGILMWLSKGKMSFKECSYDTKISGKTLAIQGFVTAISNPKGWAFFIALLPPFVDKNLPLAPQLSIILIVIIVLEFGSLMAYASSGNILKKIIYKPSNIKILNKISGSLMIFVGIWLALS